jgi:uncharacterized protein (TIGR02001 family)
VSAAPLAGAPQSGKKRRTALHFSVRFLGVLYTLMLSSPGWTQPSVSLSLLSDYRLRGYTLSKGRPVAAVALNYDHPSGLYLGVSATGVLTRSEGARFLGLQESVGFAKRLKSGVTIDAGITNTNFTHYAIERHSPGYTEVYLGLIGKRLSSHIFFSPTYIDNGLRSVFGEIDGVLSPGEGWRINWHIGAQALNSERESYYRSQVQLDGRLALTREFGRTQAQVAVSRGGLGLRRPDERAYGRTAIVFSVSHTF